VPRPEDFETPFLVVASGVRAQFGFSFCTQAMRRADRILASVEPDGTVGVASLALVGANQAEADLAFESLGQGMLGAPGLAEVPIEGLADRARGALHWADAPYEAGYRYLLFQQQRVVGAVVLASFEAPESLEEAIPLARLMLERAGSQD
jgi:hypothetical protein